MQNSFVIKFKFYPFAAHQNRKRNGLKKIELVSFSYKLAFLF